MSQLEKSKTVIRDVSVREVKPLLQEVSIREVVKASSRSPELAYSKIQENYWFEKSAKPIWEVHISDQCKS